MATVSENVTQAKDFTFSSLFFYFALKMCQCLLLLLGHGWGRDRFPITSIWAGGGDDRACEPQTVPSRTYTGRILPA